MIHGSCRGQLERARNREQPLGTAGTQPPECVPTHLCPLGAVPHVLPCQGTSCHLPRGLCPSSWVLLPASPCAGDEDTCPAVPAQLAGDIPADVLSVGEARKEPRAAASLLQLLWGGQGSQVCPQGGGDISPGQGVKQGRLKVDFILELPSSYPGRAPLIPRMSCCNHGLQSQVGRIEGWEQPKGKSHVGSCKRKR